MGFFQHDRQALVREELVLFTVSVVLLNILVQVPFSITINGTRQVVDIQEEVIAGQSWTHAATGLAEQPVLYEGDVAVTGLIPPNRYPTNLVVRPIPDHIAPKPINRVPRQFACEQDAVLVFGLVETEAILEPGVEVGLGQRAGLIGDVSGNPLSAAARDGRVCRLEAIEQKVLPLDLKLQRL